MNPDVMTAYLINDVTAMGLEQGTANSLLSKLNNTIQSIVKRDKYSAANQLNAFINELNAQSGKKLTVEQASTLKGAANKIIAAVNCGEVLGIPDKAVLVDDNGQDTEHKDGSYK